MLLSSDIAALAEKYQQVLVPDEGAHYDELVEIDLSTVRDGLISSLYTVSHSLGVGLFM